METKATTFLMLVLVVIGLGCVSQTPTVQPKPVAPQQPAAAAEPAKEAPKAEPMWEPPAKPALQPAAPPAPKPAVMVPPAKPKTPAEELGGLIAKWPQQYHVNYKITSFVGDQITEMKEEQFFKVDKERIDVAFDDGQHVTTSRTFYLPDKTVNCSALDTEKEFCIQTAKSTPVTDFGKVNSANLADYTVSADDARRIAGDQTICYKMVRNADQSEFAVCFTFDGIPLYLSTLETQDGQNTATTIEAELLERNVLDSALEAPAAQSAEGMNG